MPYASREMGGGPWESARGLAHSKTLTRGRKPTRLRDAFWSAAALRRFGTVARGGFREQRSLGPFPISPEPGLQDFKKKFRCLELMGMPSFSITASMSSQTLRFSLIAWLRNR